MDLSRKISFEKFSSWNNSCFKQQTCLCHSRCTDDFIHAKCFYNRHTTSKIKSMTYEARLFKGLNRNSTLRLVPGWCTRRPKPRSLTHFGEWKDPRDSIVAISQFVVSWISLTNFANIENSAGSIAQSTQLLKITLPKSCTIGILEHFGSIVDDSTLCFLVATPGY